VSCPGPHQFTFLATPLMYIVFVDLDVVVYIDTE